MESPAAKTGAEGGGVITVHIKTPKTKESIQTSPTASVKQFKELVSQKFGAQPDKICLIFSGRILKDEDTLDQLDITDGLTVHLVIKNNKDIQPKQEPQPSATPTTTATTANLGSQAGQTNPFGSGLQGLGGLGGLAALSAQNPQLIEQAQQQLLQNPELMSQLMNSPLIQNLFNNPEQFREYFFNNSQMQGVLERNPEIGHVLNNPQLMRQAMEIARNPALMQEMMRNQDVALRNIESLPGGHSALRRLYSEVQEPMISAAQESFRPQQTTDSNPFSALQQQTTSVPPGTENTNPLPNPWAPTTSTTTASNPSPLFGAGNTTSTTTSAASQSGQGQPLNNLFSSPGLQSMMRQFHENPELLQSAMNMPQMQQMMDTITSNPQLMEMMINNNPILAGDPTLANQVRSNIPSMVQQMQNPEFRAAMTNPEVLAAMMQIQQGMHRLSVAAPGLLPGMGANNHAAGGNVGGGNSAAMTNLLSQLATTLNAGNTGTGGGVGGINPHRPNIPQNPEIAYRPQLQQLTQMGFVDAHANLQALISTGGDLNSAIERLLQQREMT